MLPASGLRRRWTTALCLGVAAVGAVASATLITGFVDASRSAHLATIHLADVQAEVNLLRTLEQAAALGDDVSPHDIDTTVKTIRARLAQVRTEKVSSARGGELDQIDRQLGTYSSAVLQTAQAINGDDNAHAAVIADQLASPAFDELSWLIQSTTESFKARAARSAAIARWGIRATVTSFFLGMTALLAYTSRMARRLARSEADRQADERLAAVVEHAGDLVAILEMETWRPLYLSPSVRRVLGFDLAESTTLDFLDGLHGDDRDATLAELQRLAAAPGLHGQLRFRYAHRDGGWRVIDADVTNFVDNPAIGGLVLNAADVTEQLRLQNDLIHQAHHDPLTGLGNRTWFVNRLAALAGSPSERTALIVVGLDRFKSVNEAHGHGMGDNVLRILAGRLEHLTYQGEGPARLAGDTFGVLVAADQAELVAGHLLELIAEPLDLDHVTVELRASAGVLVIAEAVDGEELLRDAHLALDDAKARGGQRVSVLTGEMRRALDERLELRVAMDAALSNEEFRVVYQPKLSLGDGRVEGFEALVRWEHPERGMVPPMDFIPVAEATGQVVPIGRWVLNTALGQLREWQLQAPAQPPLTMAVNVSVRQLLDPDFVSHVAEALDTSGVEPSSVTLEVTETMLISDPEETAATLNALKALGTMIAIDDYGAGHASISYLRELPVDILKIDRSFVADLDGDADRAAAYLRAITDLAAALSLTTVAEGIEHAHHVQLLRTLGCDFGQGYHLARPLTALAASEYLTVRALPEGFSPSAPSAPPVLQRAQGVCAA